MLVTMKCEICMREFHAVHPEARYCGTNCRSKAYRARLQALARAGVRAQPVGANDEATQRAETNDQAPVRHPVESVADGSSVRRASNAAEVEHHEPHAARPVRAVAAESTSPLPNGEPNAAVRALAETLVERKLAQLQQAIEDLQKKAKAQTTEYEAALKKERKKNKKLRKKLAHSWWGDAGPIPGWVVPALTAGGGGLLVNLLTTTDGKKIGAWLADVLFSTLQTPNAADDARAGQVTLAQLIQEWFVEVSRAHGRTKGQAPVNPATQGRCSDEESEHRSASESATEGDAKQSAAPEADAGQSASSTQEAVPAPSPADPDLPESCVPWVLPRDEAADLLTELTGAQRQGEYFYAGKFDWERPLAARLVASVEPSLVWQRKRGAVWSAAWLLYRAAMSLLQLVQRIEQATKAQLPFKGLPITPTTLTLMDAVRELQARLGSHLCGIQNRLKIEFETPTELVHAAMRVEWAVKRARPTTDDRLACALHDALVDVHGLILWTHDDERYRLATHPRGAPVENSAIVENRDDVEARSDEIDALRPTAWTLERYGPPPSNKPAPPQEVPDVSLEKSNAGDAKHVDAGDEAEPGSNQGTKTDGPVSAAEPEAQAAVDEDDELDSDEEAQAKAGGTEESDELDIEDDAPARATTDESVELDSEQVAQQQSGADESDELDSADDARVEDYAGEDDELEAADEVDDREGRHWK